MADEAERTENDETRGLSRRRFLVRASKLSAGILAAGLGGLVGKRSADARRGAPPS